MLTRLLVIIGVLVVLDTYLFFGLRSVFAKNKFQVSVLVGYAILAVVSYIGFYIMIQYFQERALNATLSRNLWIGVAFSFIIFKLLFFVFLVFDDVIRVVNYLFQLVSKMMGYTPATDFNERRKFIIKLGLGVASIPFASMLYGITKGKYNYKVKKLVLNFPNLPKAFHGFKLVQISDIHSGSFDSVSDVQKGVDLINEQNADVVFFTGDLVNGDSREVLPFIDTFKSIQPKVYSILGNHDYSDYNRWDSDEAKKENADLMDVYHKEMNFELLKNEHIKIKKGTDEITVLGVENWGKGFKQKGDLDKALQGVENDAFKILLSHDPTHWDLKTIPHKTHIDLTLAGHTHGMQFGIDIPGFKWSPAKFRYARWSGLYKEAKQYLYVNKGFGFLGFPGRVGMWPEITVIELQNT
ncbi:metallophosphoesterase [Flavicella sediminum]|uniref:metallophosphoesterase n=1 Tax=Flavicella sediminum TaxID=2585141 RepID=UPI00112498A7|nr:metallophosphoesterase [Flavicella sediminum]